MRRFQDELVLTLEIAYNFKKGSRKHGIVLNWVLSGSRDKSIIKYLNEFFLLERRYRVGSQLQHCKEAEVTHVGPDRGRFGDFRLDSVLVFDCVQTCLQSAFVFALPHP